MRVFLFFLCVLVAASDCSFAQSVSGKCRYPFAASATTLVKFVIREGYQYSSVAKVEAQFRSKEFRKYFYNPTKALNYDSIFHRCFAHLRDSLGESVFCQNVYLYPNSFNISPDGKEYTLSVGFTYPNLKREAPIRQGMSMSYNETTNINYKYRKTPDGKTVITYPQNVLNCRNRADCGITVTRAKARAMLEQRGLVRPADKVHLAVAGRFWEVTLSENDWLFRHLTIDLQTGTFSAVRESRRID